MMPAVLFLHVPTLTHSGLAEALQWPEHETGLCILASAVHCTEYRRGVGKQS